MLGESSPSGHDQGDKEKELEDSEHVQNFSQSVDEWTSGQEDKGTFEASCPGHTGGVTPSPTQTRVTQTELLSHQAGGGGQSLQQEITK